MLPHRDGWAYSSTYALVASLGYEFDAASLPDGYRRMTPRHCFDNALRLAAGNPHLVYVEGFAVSVLPLHHAWCVTADGVVVDPTWEHPEECSYFGVPFSTAWVQSALHGRDTTCVLDDYDKRFLTLREGLPAEALHPLFASRLPDRRSPVT